MVRVYSIGIDGLQRICNCEEGKPISSRAFCYSTFFDSMATTPQAVPVPSVLSTPNVLALAALCIAYKVLQALYNISPLHPLSKIPGPKLAAATYIPEFWHDVVRFGCYSKEIRQMHEEYGRCHATA